MNFNNKKVSVVDRLAGSIMRLPGIGPRSARKAAFFLLNNREKLLGEMIESMKFAYENIKVCECGNLDESIPCFLCLERQEEKILCVVRDHMDLYSIRSTKVYRGAYHILGADFMPSSRNSVEVMGKLRKRVIELQVEEVILAFSPSVEGRIMLHYVSSSIADLGLNITHLALGIPIGADFDYIDHETMSAAIVARQRLT